MDPANQPGNAHPDPAGPASLRLASGLNALTAAQLRQAELIYEGGFSPELRVPFGELARPGDHDQTYVALQGTAPAGVAALRLLGSVQWSFLRYFAIAEDRRGQGLGRQFLRLLGPSLRAAGWPASVVFEVEDPADAPGDQAERLIRQRRISFWTACGARLLPAAGYVLPDYTGSGFTEPMLLMAASESTVSGDRLRELVLAIYTDRYGLPSDDPLVLEALASIVV
jgi:GNAT superfamily N-acetyltransferase